MHNTMITMSEVDISAKPGIWRKPSTAEVTETGGVMIPSANNAAPPIWLALPAIFFVVAQAHKTKYAAFPVVVGL